jgi:hypothetical protein
MNEPNTLPPVAITKGLYEQLRREAAEREQPLAVYIRVKLEAPPPADGRRSP